jgi:hypothetical protein
MISDLLLLNLKRYLMVEKKEVDMPVKALYNSTISCEEELKEQFDAALYGKSTKGLWQHDIDGFRNLGRPKIRAIRKGESAREILKKSLEIIKSDFADEKMS